MISQYVKYKDHISKLKSRNKKYSIKFSLLWIFLFLGVILLSSLSFFIPKVYFEIIFFFGLFILMIISFYIFFKKTENIALNLKEKIILNLYHAEVYLAGYLKENIEDRKIKKSRKFILKIAEELGINLKPMGFNSSEVIINFLKIFGELINKYLLKKINIYTSKEELEKIHMLLVNLFINIEEDNLEQAIKICEYKIKNLKEKGSKSKSLFDNKKSSLLEILFIFILGILTFLLIKFIPSLLFNIPYLEWNQYLIISIAITALLHKPLKNIVFKS